MIEKIQIEKFRAIGRIIVGLRPLTVLIGPNDSGKTSFLEAIQKQVGNRFEPHDFAYSASALPTSERHPLVRLRVRGGDTFSGQVEMFRLPSEGIPMESAGQAEEGRKGAPPLQVSGANLAAFLDYLLRKDRPRFDAIQATLQTLVPGLHGITITTPSADSRAVTLKIDGGWEIAGSRLSTGARMIFFFVALAHHPDPPDVVLLEEPENGVHPKRLQDIVALLRGMTEGKLSGHPTQIILATHSPYLLDLIRPLHDQVLVFHRQDDGQRMATVADEARLKTFLDEFKLGEVWFNQGEEGLVTAAR